MLSLPPLALYVHVPWCVRKCPYCDFNSHTLLEELPEAAYIEALLADLDTELADVQGRTLTSIFIGGGTPSLVSGVGYQRLLTGIRERMTLAPDIEITLEANPGTFERERFADFRRAGINRLSVGVQSFDNDALARLGRIHDADEAVKAITAAREVGFDEINIDLMHGLPGQTVHQIDVDLVKTDLARGGNGLDGLVGVMDASQSGQGVIVKTLHPHREPVDAGAAKICKALALEGARIGFQRDLDVRCQRHAFTNAGQQPLVTDAADQTGRAATDEDGRQRPPLDIGQLGVEIGQQRLDIGRFGQLFQKRMRVEIAVGALAHAPWDMDIERQGWQGQHQRPSCSSRAVSARPR